MSKTKFTSKIKFRCLFLEFTEKGFDGLRSPRQLSHRVEGLTAKVRKERGFENSEEGGRETTVTKESSFFLFVIS